MGTISSKDRLLTAEELPDSDETPVDNELQNYIPNLLLNILLDIWGDSQSGDAYRRQDWFFGVDMGVYYDQNKPAIVPDGFLAVGVPRWRSEDGRPSYVIYQEKVPILTLEVISREYNSEYEDKLAEFQQLGVLYYVIYNSFAGKKRKYKKHQPIEVYKLIDGEYQLLSGNSVWMPEIELGIGCESQEYANCVREWVFWYDKSDKRYLTESEKVKAAEANTWQIWQEKEKLATHLRSLGINPDDIV